MEMWKTNELILICVIRLKTKLILFKDKDPLRGNYPVLKELLFY